MALKHPGQNPPLDAAKLSHMNHLGEAVDVATVPRRDIDRFRVDRPYTRDEVAWALEHCKLRKGYELLEVPWDERDAAALVDIAKPHYPSLAVVLLAASGQPNEARALNDEVRVLARDNARFDLRDIGQSELASGHFDPPVDWRDREYRLGCIADLTRFRVLAEQLAGAAPTLRTQLPRLFERSYTDTYVAVWTPVLECFALLAEADAKKADDGFKKHLEQLASVKVSINFGQTSEHKRAGLTTLFWLALHRGRLLAAHRIAGKMNRAEQYHRLVRVAVEYVKAGDPGGAWEITKQWESPPSRCDHLVQALQDAGWNSARILPVATPANASPDSRRAVEAEGIEPETDEDDEAPRKAPSKRAALKFAPALASAITRLGGVVPPDAWSDRVSVATVQGSCELSPVVSAFTRVQWPSDLVFAAGEPESEYGFGVTEMLEDLAEGFTGPLVAIAYDESQYFLVVRVDDTSADPLVYRIDHDGSSSLEGGKKLSAVLKGTSKTSTTSAEGVGPQMIEAIRELDPVRAIEIVKREGRRAVEPIDRSGFTPLHYACMAGMTDVVNALLAAGADPNAAMRSSMKLGVRFTRGRWTDGREAMKGEVPLHAALIATPRPLQWTHDTIGVVRALLASGASLNVSEIYGRTLLQQATQLPRADTPVVEALLAAGADPHHTSLTGGSPLCNSLVAGPDRVRLLLAAGADPNRVTQSSCGPVRGATAIHMAAWMALDKVLTLMLDAGGDPNVKAGDGTLPLACALGKTVDVLRERGATGPTYKPATR